MNGGLALRNVTVALGGRDVAIDATLDVPRGTVVGLVGPNGAGKSSLLRAAAGLLAPRSGEVLLDGRLLNAWGRGALARQLAVVPQAPSLPPLFAVRDVVALGRTPYLPFLGQESARDRQAVAQAMEVAGVGALAARRAGEISGGERQRVAIARALAQEPRVLLLDEPTASLDLRYQSAMLDLFRQLAAGGVACLVVLHDLGLAGQACDRVALMSGGRIVADGTPHEVFDEALLSEVYGTPLRVVHHPDDGTPLVVHGRREAARWQQTATAS